MDLQRRRWVAWSLSGASAAVALAGCSKARLPAAMKIGVIAPLTGPFGARGKDLLAGANLAADEINAAGYKIAGRRMPVEIVGVDDKADVETARQAARKLLDMPVHAVIGPLLTPQAVAIIPIVAEEGVPQLFTATAAHLHTLGRGNTFRLQAADDLQGRTMAVFAHENLHAQRIAAVVETGGYGQGLFRAFTEALRGFGRGVIVSLDVDGKADVTAAMASSIKAAQADVVVLCAGEPQLRSLYTALASVNYTSVSVLGPDLIRSKNVPLLPMPVRALYATATSFDAEEFPEGRPFLETFTNKYKVQPASAAPYAYDAVYALTDAARRAGTLDSATLVKTLKSIDPITRVNQQMRFTAGGELMHPAIAAYKAEHGVWLAQMRASVW